MKKIQFNSPVVLTFFFFSLFALVLGEVTGGASNILVFSVYRSSFLNPLTYLRLVGHVLGHANISHFFSNMLLFLVVGPPLEKMYGSKTLAGCILATAVTTGILQIVIFPNSVLLGASGIVFMLILLSSLSGARSGKIPLTMILVAAMYLGREVYSILFVDDNIANLIHIAGGLCGICFGFSLNGKAGGMNSERLND